MPFLCLRIDLDYVPWDTPDGNEFGHGEPALFLKLLDLARLSGDRLHFFISSRVLRAFPSTAEAVLNEGHDLDWFSKHPEEPDARYPEAAELFQSIGHTPLGMALRGYWPEDGMVPHGMQFVSAQGTKGPPRLHFFPVETKSDREAVRAGTSARMWTDSIKAGLRETASRNRAITVCVRPQVLAKFDPKLTHVKEILDLARAVELPVRTLRQALSSSEA